MSRFALDHYDGVYVLFVLVFYIQLKTPLSLKLFSERYGHDKPLIDVAGHRLFVGRSK
jgi:hypothetical protein